MARVALLHLLRSQSRIFRSGGRHGRISPRPDMLIAKIDVPYITPFAVSHRRWAYHTPRSEDDNKINMVPHEGGGEAWNKENASEVVYYGGRYGRVGPRPDMLSAKIDVPCITSFAVAHRRRAYHTPPAEGDSKINMVSHEGGGEEWNKENASVVVYYGPHSNLDKILKLLSNYSCYVFVPWGLVLLTLIQTLHSMNVSMEGIVLSMCFVILQNAAVHWYFGPYVHKLSWKPGSNSFEVETMSWEAPYLRKTIKFSDIRPANTCRGCPTFRTNDYFIKFKANDKFYVIVADHCHNKVLLTKLNPRKRAYESP